MIQSSSTRIRASGLLSMMGGIVWMICCSGIALNEDAERVWRLFMNLAILCFIAGLVGWHAAQDGRTGKLGLIAFIVSLLALVTMIVGNLVEFGIGDLMYEDVRFEWEPTDHLGWTIMGASFMVLPFGFVVLGIASIKAQVLSVWRRSVPLVFGSIMILLFLQGVVVLLLTDVPVQEGWMVTPIFSFGLAWVVLGYALWSKKSCVSSCLAPEQRN